MEASYLIDHMLAQMDVLKLSDQPEDDGEGGGAGGGPQGAAFRGRDGRVVREAADHEGLGHLRGSRLGAFHAIGHGVFVADPDGGDGADGGSGETGKDFLMSELPRMLR